MTEDLSWLQSWYKTQCNGDWEHSYGVSIKTIDNPGWWITLCIEGTDVEGLVFALEATDRDEDDWIRLESDGFKIVAHGGALNLLEMLNRMRKVVEHNSKRTESGDDPL